jgi:hypothetical protein
MPDAGCRMPDAGCRMPDAGCRMPDAGCRMPDAGCRMPDAGCRMPDAGKPEARAEGIRVGVRWSNADSLSLRFGLPNNPAGGNGQTTQSTTVGERRGTTGAGRRGTTRDRARRSATTAPTRAMPGAGKPEARAEGIRFGVRWSNAYSLSLRFGLPSNPGTTVGDRRYSAGTTVSHRRSHFPPCVLNERLYTLRNERMARAG